MPTELCLDKLDFWFLANSIQCNMGIDIMADETNRFYKHHDIDTLAFKQNKDRVLVIEVNKLALHLPSVLLTKTYKQI